MTSGDSQASDAMQKLFQSQQDCSVWRTVRVGMGRMVQDRSGECPASLLMCAYPLFRPAIHLPLLPRRVSEQKILNLPSGR